MARAAEDKGTRLIPVLLPGLRQIPRPMELEGLDWIDLRKGIDKLGVGQLIDAIKDKAPRPVPESKPAPRRKKARPSAKAPAGVVATNGSIAVGTNKGGIITVGNGNRVRVGNRGW